MFRYVTHAECVYYWSRERTKTINLHTHSDLKSHKIVTDHLRSQQLLHFDFAQ